MNLISCLFLIVSVVCLNALSTQNMETRFDYITKQMRKHAASRPDLFKSDTKWIEQPLDHFDSQEKRTWKMKYYQNLRFFVKNGPIYIFIGGEGAIYDNFRGLYIFDLANETHGALIESEHRYYGESIPLNMSVVENMKYLSSQQALADLSHLIKTLKSSPEFKDSKVAVIGGSYAGNLAAWMRLKYPELVDAAWASSAPVLAKKNFFEYTEKVGEDYKHYGPNGCYEKVIEIFNRYNKLLQSTEGIKQLKNEENICADNDLTQPLNIASFFENMCFRFKANAQYWTPSEIKAHCENIMNRNPVIMKQNKYYKENLENKYENENNCHDFEFSHKKKRITPQFWSWIYQTCTEFGYFQTLESDKQPFTRNMNVDYFIKLCSLLYGPDFNEKRVDKAVAFTNKHYGGMTPNVTKVVFVHGGMDPWSPLGITKDLSDDAPARVIHDASHCSDVFASSPHDSDEQTKTKAFVRKMLKKWLDIPSRPTEDAENFI